MPMPTARQRSSARPVEVLLDSKAGVDARAVQEIAAHRGAGALRRDKDHVHILRRDDLGLLLVGDGEAVGEVQRIARLQVLLERGPDRLLRRVGNEALDDRAALNGFFDVEKVFALLPAVLHGAIPIFLNPCAWPTMTLKPLSRMFRPWAGPCTP
jgi:hypothetical protein